MFKEYSLGLSTPSLRTGRVITLGVNREGHEADRSSLSIDGFNNAWSFTSSPTTRFMEGV